MPSLRQRSCCRLVLAAVAGLLPAPSARAAETHPVIVHEWGTFTSLQDESGANLGGINVDDEPVPWFVCGDGGRTVVPQHGEGNFGLPPYSMGKAWALNDPAVTLRLETPVLYIYAPKGIQPQSVPPLTVHVAFNGGVLSQFYPHATFSGLTAINGMHEGALTSSTTTGLTWGGVRLGSTLSPPSTDDPVWTTPRETSAPILQVDAPRRPDGSAAGEPAAEHFLFYRGVGHLDAPLRLRQLEAGGPMQLYLARGAIGVPLPGWLVEIRPDGTCAFRAVEERKDAGEFNLVFLGDVNSSFANADFSTANLSGLQAAMQAELVKQGLYPDEASAMLRTWEVSYFKSPGLRFFYIVPRVWTDRVLPLQVTGAPTRITRVMVGRIELISGAEKAALAQLADGPCPDLNAVENAAQQALAAGKFSPAEKAAFQRGDRPLRDLGVAIPPEVQEYLDLGRFRDVLILREDKARPTKTLATFIQKYRLGEMPEETGVAAAGQ